MFSTLYKRSSQCSQAKLITKRWFLIAFTITAALLMLLSYHTIFYDREPPKESDGDVVQDRESGRLKTEQVAMELFLTENHILQEAHAAMEGGLPHRFRDWARLKKPWYQSNVQKSRNGTGDPYACDNQPLPLPLVMHVIATHLAYSNESFVDPVFPPLAWMTEERTFPTKSKVCIRVILPSPKQGKRTPFWYKYQPYDSETTGHQSAWWDTMMVWAHHDETGAAVQLKMRPWKGHTALRLKRRKDTSDGQTPGWFVRIEEDVIERELIHVYETEIELRDPGHYRLEALLEFIQAQWNFENGPIVPYQPQTLQFYPSASSNESSPVLEARETDNGSSVSDTADKIIEKHLALPLCKGANHPGRWLPWNDTINTTATAGVNMHNKFWAPYDCRYRHLQYTEFNRCLARRYSNGIDMYGDSNMRRAVKKILTQGRWCDRWQDHRGDPVIDPNRAEPQADTPEEWKWTGHPGVLKACHCEDHSEPGWNALWYASDHAEKNQIVFRNSVMQSEALGETEWDRDRNQKVMKPDEASVTSYKLDGLTTWNARGWDFPFKDPWASRDVVIVSLGNWDPAYMTLDEFGKQLSRFVDKLQERYRQTYPKIIYRTAQYYCCRVDNSTRHRRTSGPRTEAFNQLARDVLTSRMNATVWDTSILGEAQSWEEKQDRIDCPSNHASADTVEIENQILMNALCN